MVMAISWFTLISPQSDHLSIADYDDTAIGVGTLTWQDPVHSWKAGPGEVMTVENKQTQRCNHGEIFAGTSAMLG